MNEDTYKIRLLTEYERMIADKKQDSFLISILLGCIVAGMFVAVVLAIYAIKCGLVS